MERAHFSGRLYQEAMKLLGRKPSYFLKPDALEFALAKLFERRGFGPPKWFVQTDRDRALREAAERARADFRRESESGGTAGAGAEDGRQGEPSYYEDKGGIWHRKVRPNGEPYGERLTNFTARIAVERLIDDGLQQWREYLIGADGDGSKYLVEVGASDFASLDWIREKLPAHFGVLPGRGTADHAQWAIRQLSVESQRKTLFAHSGMRRVGEAHCYLHAQGALPDRGADTAIETRLPQALERLVLPQPDSDPREAVRAALQFVDLTDARITAPIFGAIWRAPLGEADFSLHIAGSTGAFKTELAALAQGHFGAGFDAGHLPCDWTWTENALEELAFAAKDAVLVIDDFRPPTDYRERDALMRKAERVFRAQGNRQGRGRLNRDIQLRQPRPPRCLVISTGEIYPRGQSLAGRILFIDLVAGEIEPARLTACQRDRDHGLYASAMAAYVTWLAERFADTGSRARQLARDVAAEVRGGNLHARTPGVIGELLAGACCSLAFAVDCSALEPEAADQLEQRIWHGLLSAGGAQAEFQLSQEPARRFIELLTSALASGSAHVVTTEGGRPEHPGNWGWRENDLGGWEPKQMKIGWLDAEGLYLEPDAAYKAAHLMASGSSGIEVGQTALWKRLRDAGLLGPREASRETLKVRKMIDGERRSVIHLRRDAVGEVSVLLPDQPDQTDHVAAPAPNRSRWQVLRSGKSDQTDHKLTTNQQGISGR
ncbi:MAG: hypothetical protein ACHQZS_00190 [Candidatus Binatales bacterium]